MYSIDISSDRIVIYTDNTPHCLAREAIEQHFPLALVELWKNNPFQELLVINGPGGFTNLRVGTLALNLLKVLHQDQLTFFTLSKLELYALGVKRWWLPLYWVIYIGQKSNVWVRDFAENRLLKAIKKQDILKELEGKDFFVDQVADEEYFAEGLPLLGWKMEEGKWLLHYQGKSYSLAQGELGAHQVEKLIPNYMIDPNVN